MGESVTRSTCVWDAYHSSPQAAEIFRRHGVDPAVSCGLAWTSTPLSRAPILCHLRDLNGLLAELAAAAAAPVGPPARA